MPETSAAPLAGLVTRQGQPVPLSGIEIRADVSSLGARVTIAQRYVNRESAPIEAVYVFPLDERSAVCGFEALIDGTLVVGEIRTRDEAFEAYDEAMARGDGAFLLDEERPDVFVASVGNLPPGKEVLLKIVYVTELGVTDEGLRFTVPTTVSPRYAPAADHRGVGRPDADTLNPPLAWQVPYGLSLMVEVTLPDALTRLESPSHPIGVTVNGRQATVTLSQQEAALDRDFVLLLDASSLEVPHAWIERDNDNENDGHDVNAAEARDSAYRNGRTAVAVGFYPRMESARTPADVIFLVDRSGSMAGESIAQVRNALQLCLRAIVPGCRFNIIGFGTRFEALFPEGRPYDDTSLAEASAHVAALQADMGGTEILPALQFALESARDASLSRQVLVLTDGQVTNTDAVLALAAEHSAHARVFSFGIGKGASHHLVRGLARAGRGAAEFIYPGERIEKKVVRQFDRLLSPVLTDVQVDWGGLQVTQAPSRIPPVFAGSRLVLYAFVDDLRPATIRLSASAASGRLAFDVPLDPGDATTGRTIATLAARERIRELEEAPEWAKARGSRQTRGASATTKEIVALSIRYGLMSRETSFVAIERRDTPVVGDVQLRRVPIALTSGWGNQTPSLMMAGTPMAVMFDAEPILRTAPRDAPRRGFDSRLDSISDIFGANNPNTPDDVLFLATLGVRDQSGSLPDRLSMQALVTEQRADGTWTLTTELAAAIGCDLATLELALREPTVLRAIGAPPEHLRSVWATMLAIVWLEQRATALESEWRPLVRKAEARLKALSAPRDRARLTRIIAALLAGLKKPSGRAVTRVQN